MYKELVYCKNTKEIYFNENDFDGYETQEIYFELELFEYYKIIAKKISLDFQVKKEIIYEMIMNDLISEDKIKEYEEKYMEELYNASRD